MNLKLLNPIAVALLAGCCALLSAAADKNVLLIAGTPSHAPMEHEHNAGVLLFKKWLGTVKGIHVTAHLNGWPADATDLETADAILLYCDGAESHMAFKENHAEILDKAAQRGVGMVFLHYAVEPPRGTAQNHMLGWIGGAFELNYSVNPVWEADFEKLPKHPITNGVKPFRLRDEWYYNMRFPEGMPGVTPILTAVPPASTLSQPDGPRSGNPEVRAKAGQPQQMAWAFERPGGGRGFGFTGVHYHKNWGDENFRKIVLNAVVWVAKAKVPARGVTVTVRPEELGENLDPKPARK